VLEAAADYVEQYRQLWEQRFDRLDDYLHTLQAAPENDTSQP
jgi:hypothetical protein